MKKTALIGAVMSAGALLSLNASAADLDLSYHESSTDVMPSSTMLLASAADSRAVFSAVAAVNEPVFNEPSFTANDTHKYLGLTSLALAGLTILAPKPHKDDSESGLHHTLGQAAAVTGGAAVATGVVIHYDDLNWTTISDPDTLHALLGTLGTMGYIMAVGDAPATDHAAAGSVGAACMLAAIKITW